MNVCRNIFLTVALCVALLSGCAQQNGTNAAGSSVAPSIPDVTVVDLLYDVPEGFVASEDSPMVYYAPDGSGSSFNIQYTQEQETTPDFDEDAMAQYLKEGMETQLSQQLGLETDITVEECAHASVDGQPGMRAVLSYELNGVAFHQMIYTVAADGTYTFTYTQLGDSDWMDAFQASVDSIDFVLEGE